MSEHLVGRAQTCLLDSVRTSIAPDCFRVRITASAFGHTFGFLKKDPVGDELTFAYTYENAGTHGFLHTDFGEDTESVGVMKNFALPKVKLVSGYTWIQGGITSYTGNAKVRNRFDSSASLGAVVHLSYHSSIWIQESYNKVVTVPWYTTSSVSYTYSW